MNHITTNNNNAKVVWWDQLWWAWQSVHIKPLIWASKLTLETVKRKSWTLESHYFELRMCNTCSHTHLVWILLSRLVCVRAWDDLRMRENHAQCVRFGRSAINFKPIQYLLHTLQKLLGYFNHNWVTSVASSDAWQWHHGMHAWNEVSESRE